MRKVFLVTAAMFSLVLAIALSCLSLAQEWGFRVRPRGTITAVDLFNPEVSAMLHYAESLIMLDKDNNWVPGLAEDYRWLDDRRIEFKLREGVRFHNGRRFNAEVVRVNWEEYREMETPRPCPFYVLPDETIFEMIDEYTVRFTMPEPDGIAFVKFAWFFQMAPEFYTKHKFHENGYGYIPEPGPWGTGPFELVEGSLRFGQAGGRFVLEANQNYWDQRYPKLERVIFDNSLIGDRDEAMRLCREREGKVDVVNRIRPLDTLKVAESPFAKVVKSKDVSALVGWFNQRKKDSKLRDVRLRKALNYAVNREELWKYAAKGNAHDLGGYIPTGAHGHNPSVAISIYDTDKARSLLTEAGYGEGFGLTIIAWEALKLEAQIIGKMLERIGLDVKQETLPMPEWYRKTYHPYLDRPPEEQDWDISIWWAGDWFGHTGATFLTYGLIEESDWMWIEKDTRYEQMWKDLTLTLDREAQEEKIRRMVKYLYDQAYLLFIYSPLSLYAVNKEVDFIPQKSFWLRFKETSVTDSHWSLRDQE